MLKSAKCGTSAGLPRRSMAITPRGYSRPSSPSPHAIPPQRLRPSGCRQFQLATDVLEYIFHTSTARNPWPATVTKPHRRLLITACRSARSLHRTQPLLSSISEWSTLLEHASRVIRSLCPRENPSFVAQPPTPSAAFSSSQMESPSLAIKESQDAPPPLWQPISTSSLARAVTPVMTSDRQEFPTTAADHQTRINYYYY